MAVFVDFFVVIALLAAVFLGWDDGSCAIILDVIDDLITVIPLVSQDISGVLILQQRQSLRAVCHLAASDNEPERIAERIA